ncbi:MAG: LysE family translocator [Deltaproteobacteria bacterium]
MPDLHTLLAFAAVALAMVMTPGPNMIYLVSRSISQGPLAGLISLIGVALAFVVFMLSASFGITALMLSVPYAYDALRFAGAAYLLFIAWQTLKPGGATPFQVRNLPKDSNRKLFAMGFVTNILNPKAAVMYLSILPQFIHPEAGSVLGQSLALGSLQISVSFTVNTVIVFTAGGLARFLATRPTWALVQRWIMGTVLAGFAVRMATEARR